MTIIYIKVQKSNDDKILSLPFNQLSFGSGYDVDQSEQNRMHMDTEEYRIVHGKMQLARDISSFQVGHEKRIFLALSIDDIFQRVAQAEDVNNGHREIVSVDFSDVTGSQALEKSARQYRTNGKNSIAEAAPGTS